MKTIDFSKSIDDFTYPIYLAHLQSIKNTKKPLSTITHQFIDKLHSKIASIPTETDLAIFKSYCYEYRIITEAMHLNKGHKVILNTDISLLRYLTQALLINPLLKNELAIETFKYSSQILTLYPNSLEEYLKYYKLINLFNTNSISMDVYLTYNSIYEFHGLKSQEYLIALFVQYHCPDIPLPHKLKDEYDKQPPEIDPLQNRQKLYNLLQELHDEHVNTHTN